MPRIRPATRANAQEQDRLPRRLAQRERGAAARVAVHLGEHQPFQIDALREDLADAHRFLPRHPVHHQQHVVGARGAIQLLELDHQRLVHVLAPRGVQHHEVEPAHAPLLERPGGDRPRRAAFRRAPEGGARHGRQLLELLDRGRPVDVGAREQHALAAAPQPLRELARERGLARALQPGEQHHLRNVRRVGERDRGLPEQALQLVLDDPHHLLSGGEAPEHLFADRPGLDPGDEVACHADLHVGFEQGPTHLPQAIPDVVRVEFTLPGQPPGDPLQTVGKCLEHWPLRIGKAGNLAQGQAKGKS
jgi:hypothetical protein